MDVEWRRSLTGLELEGGPREASGWGVMRLRVVSELAEDGDSERQVD